MSAPRFEIVRTKAGHHARFVAANGRVVWSTEVYKRRAGAVGAVRSLEEGLLSHARTPMVDVDERYVPPAVELSLPIWRREIRPLIREGRRLAEGEPETFWHDQEYHYRQCWESDCVEETPPVGTVVRSRMGEAALTETESSK